LFSDKEHLLGKHAINEYLCFAVLDEAIFYGDKKTADLLKSVIVNPTRVIDPKYQALREIANMYGLWLLTNHDYAVPAGHGARRPVILDVSQEKAEDEAYFTRLAEAIAAGGAGQFLHWLLHTKLAAGWHPRKIIRTEELVEHQRASLPPTYKWLHACAETGTPVIDRLTRNGLKAAYGILGDRVPLAELYRTFLEWAKNNACKEPVIIDQFGKHMTEIFGPKRRLPVNAAGKRPYAYAVPDDEDVLKEKIDAARSIYIQAKKRT
jgi:hypothetical protein